MSAWHALFYVLSFLETVTICVVANLNQIQWHFIPNGRLVKVIEKTKHLEKTLLQAKIKN